MAGRRVHKTGAGVIGDVVAFEQGDLEIISATSKRMSTPCTIQNTRDHFSQSSVGFNSGGFENIRGKIVCENISLAGFCPVFCRRVHDLVKSVGNRSEER